MKVLLIILSLIIYGVVGHSRNSDASESSNYYSATRKNQNFTLFRHDISTGARCLDGSQGGLYTYKGKQTDKWVIYFQGGGICVGASPNQVLSDCLSRSQTPLGSSSFYPNERNFERYSFLSSNKTINPLFYKYNKAYFIYCDGQNHLSSITNPVNTNGVDIYLRGANNSYTNFKYLNETFQFFNAKKIVITGTSAGAVASLHFSNYVYENANNPSEVLIIPDSAITGTQFVNPFNSISIGTFLLQIHITIGAGEIGFPIKQCTADNGLIACFSVGTLAQYIKPRVFIIQSLYDAFGLIDLALATCLQRSMNQQSFATNLGTCLVDPATTPIFQQLFQQFRTLILDQINQVISIQRNGAWAIDCSAHTFTIQVSPIIQSPNYVVVSGSTDITILTALRNFIRGRGSRKNIDNVMWPNNLGCNGICSQNCLICNIDQCSKCNQGFILLPNNECLSYQQLMAKLREKYRRK